LVRPVRLDPNGLSGPTRGQARSRQWARSSHGYYVPSGVDRAGAEQRILEASVLVPRGGAVTGWAALCWQGGRWFTGKGPDGTPLPVPLLISTADIRPQSPIVVCGEGCGPAHVRVVDGVPVTDPVWTVAFLMRRAVDVRTAVMVFDMAAYSDLVSTAEVTERLGQQCSWTGIPQAREALALVSENAWSPQEVFMRLSWTIAGGRRMPETNVPLFDSLGQHIGTPDLLDRAAGVVGEYDGTHHLARDRRVGDIDREEVFRAHGLEIVRSTAGGSLDSFLTRLHGAYRRAGRRTGSRSWTADPPPGWISTRTVDQRRALSADLRGRLLRYRSA